MRIHSLVEPTELGVLEYTVLGPLYLIFGAHLNFADNIGTYFHMHDNCRSWHSVTSQPRPCQCTPQRLLIAYCVTDEKRSMLFCLCLSLSVRLSACLVWTLFSELNSFVRVAADTR